MLEIATGLLVYIVTTHGNQGVADEPALKVQAQKVRTVPARDNNLALVPRNTPVLSKSQAEVKQKVKEYFADTPLLSEIASCESRFNQFGKDGSIYRGEINPADVGVMQINEYYHLQTSKKLGLDIHTLEGNMAYARYLYEREGSVPWNSSSYCWRKYESISSKGGQLALAKK